MKIMNNPRALRMLREECERAKIRLSFSTKTVIDIIEFMDGEDLTIEITRDKFEDLCNYLFRKCLIPIGDVLNDSKMCKSQIDKIILTGGSSKIPKIKSMIREYLNGFNNIVQQYPDDIVSSGAAIQGAILSKIYHKKIKMPILLDVCPHSIGFETIGGIMKVIIPKGNWFPCKRADTFLTYADNQEQMLIQIYEGERVLTKDNILIDKIVFDGLPLKPRRQIGVEITLDIDADFILSLCVVEKTTGKKIKKIIS